MTESLEGLDVPLVYAIDDESLNNVMPPSVRFDEAQRTYVRSLSGMQKEAIVSSRVSEESWRIACDEGEYLQGDDVAPSPLSIMTAGMAASFSNNLLALAEQRSIELADVTLVQDNFYTMQGSVLRGTMTAGALPIELKAVVDTNADEATLHDLVETAVTMSPINGMMRTEQRSKFNLTVNAEEIPRGGVPEPDGSTLPDDPRETFDELTPDADKRELPRIRRTGRKTRSLAESEQGYTSREGSSLQEQQDRILHYRGICNRRDDGLNHVEVKSFSPRGTIFEFLSDEPVERGGHGRAPDAMTYISAGIGFCFTTQLGRYAEIVNKELSEYRIVQDTHFPLNREAEELDTMGEAVPVETHVFLDTPEDVEFARDTLRMAEQTCFLHAFCRTELDEPTIEIDRN